MAAKYLTFSFFLSLILFFSQAYGKTIHGKARIIDGDTVHIGKNKMTFKRNSYLIKMLSFFLLLLFWLIISAFLNIETLQFFTCTYIFSKFFTCTYKQKKDIIL